MLPSGGKLGRWSEGLKGLPLLLRPAFLEVVAVKADLPDGRLMEAQLHRVHQLFGADINVVLTVLGSTVRFNPPDTRPQSRCAADRPCQFTLAARQDAGLRRRLEIHALILGSRYAGAPLSGWLIVGGLLVSAVAI